MSKFIGAGQMRDIVTIERPGPLDSNGNPNPEWLTNLAGVYAFVDELGGDDKGPDRSWDPRVGNTQLIPTETHRVTIWYLPGLDATNRLVMYGRVLKIISVSDIQSLHRQMVLSCQEQIGVTG